MTDLHITPAAWIRTAVFGVATQKEFADLLGFRQATISRAETGAQRISTEMQQRIRDLAEGMGIPWDNNWFFSIPVMRKGDDNSPQLPSV